MNKIECLLVLREFSLSDNLVDFVNTGLKELGIALHHLIVEGVGAEFVDLYRCEPIYWHPLRL